MSLEETKTSTDELANAISNSNDDSYPTAGFSFGFGFAPDEEENGDDTYTTQDVSSSTSILIDIPAVKFAVPFANHYAVVVKAEPCLFGRALSRGDVVLVLWDSSSHYELEVLRVVPETCEVESEESFLIRSNAVRLLTPSDDRTHSIPMNPALEVINDDYALEFDGVFQSPQKLTSSPHYLESPMEIDAGLESLAWPLTKEEFLSRVFRRKCFFSHGAGKRLDSLRENFQDFDVKAMIDASSRVVVWMKASKTGKMQYIEANADVGHNAYQAGHTLYFNPDLGTQEKFIRSLCLDLGFDFGIEKETGSFGGDLEIFAVNTKHCTPWHYDAQENFSIQLVGTKKWYFVPSDLEDPATNLHPSSTNRASVEQDFHAHRSTRGDFVRTQTFFNRSTGRREVVDLDSDPRVRSVVVRPGSVFYHPAGFWHKVEALTEEGSLSINFSIDTLRWSELVMPRLNQLLLAEPLFRRRVIFSPAAAQNAELARNVASSHVKAMIERLQGLLEEIDSEDFVPASLFLQNRPQKRLKLALTDKTLSYTGPKKRKTGTEAVESRDDVMDSSELMFMFHDQEGIKKVIYTPLRELRVNPLVSIARSNPVVSFSGKGSDLATTATEGNLAVYAASSGFGLDSLVPHHTVKLAFARQYLESVEDVSTKGIFDALVKFMESIVEHPLTKKDSARQESHDIFQAAFSMQQIRDELQALLKDTPVGEDQNVLKALTEDLVSILLHIGVFKISKSTLAL